MASGETKDMIGEEGEEQQTKIAEEDNERLFVVCVPRPLLHILVLTVGFSMIMWAFSPGPLRHNH